MCSSQFNLTRMFLNSLVACFLGLMILFHLLVNCLGVVWIDCLYVRCVCFDCASHQWCTVGIYCASAASKWPFFQREKGFFLVLFPQKKWKFFFQKKITWRQAWREPDVRRQTSAPHHLTVWRQARQLSLMCLSRHTSTRRVTHQFLHHLPKLSWWFFEQNKLVVYLQLNKKKPCLLWIDNVRAKDKTYVWVSVWWKTKN
jgi:hypothetical protein